MIVNLAARIARLEAQRIPSAIPETPFTPGIRLLWLILAVHAGDLREHEAVAEGTARALGYERAGELRAAMRAEGTASLEWGSRHGNAITSLLSANGGGLSAGMPANEAAIRALLSDVPAELRSRMNLGDAEDAIRAATEWVSL